MTTHAPEVERAAGERRPAEGRLDDRLFVACGLAWTAGLLHAVAALGQPPLALAAAAQFAWGVALYRRPGRRLLLAGAVLSVGVAAIWLASRTVLESVAVGDEVALALLALSQLRSRRAGRIASGFRAAGMAAAVYLILLSSLLLMPGSQQRGVKGSLVGVPRAGLELLCHAG